MEIRTMEVLMSHKSGRIIREKTWTSKATLKKAICKYLGQNIADALDIADIFRIELRRAVELVDELRREGKIRHV